VIPGPSRASHDGLAAKHGAASMSGFLIETGQTLLMTGDSITDAGRLAEDQGPLGVGYVRMTADFIQARYPERAVRVINTGIAGHTVVDLGQRWQRDVLDHAADWLSVMIGINDLHGHIGGDPGLGPERYRETLGRLLEQARTAGARLLVIDPFYMCRSQEADPQQRQVLDLLPHYLEASADLARSLDARHVPTDEVFQRILEHVPARDLGPEAVHPYPAGHAIIAHAVLGALDW
jgi:acyl-CoA thioesterase-1